MTIQEIKDQLTVGDYGEMCLRNKLGYNMICMGTVIFISKKGTVTFYDNDKIEHHKRPEEIKYFIQKEKLPAPTEYAGEAISFDNGRWIYTKSGKEIDIKR